MPSIKNSSISILFLTSFTFVAILLFPKAPALASHSETSKGLFSTSTTIEQEIEITQGDKTKKLFETLFVELSFEKEGPSNIKINCNAVRAALSDLHGQIASYDSSSDSNTNVELLDSYTHLCGSSVTAQIASNGSLSPLCHDSPLALISPSTFPIFPKEKLSPGLAWSYPTKIDFGSPRIIDTSWRCESIENGVVTLSLISTIRGNSTAPISSLNGLTMEPEFTGSERGSVRLDETTGLLLDGTIQSSFVRTIYTANPKADPISMKVTSTTRIERL